jgi:hypothetical protein
MTNFPVRGFQSFNVVSFDAVNSSRESADQAH